MVIVTRPRDHQDKLYRSTSTDYTQAYTRIVKDARGGRGSHGDYNVGTSAGASGSSSAAPVLLLVAADVDALCATKALTALLRDDDVAYRICPVDGYATLQTIIEEDVAANDELSAVIFINLGSLLSLPNYFCSASSPVPEAHILPAGCTIHLIDSHRPYNLDNLFATSELMERIYVWDDGEIEEQHGREEKAYAALEFIDDMSSDEESEEEEEDDVRSSSGPPSDGEDGSQAGRSRSRKRRRRQDSNGNDISPMPKTKKLPANVLASYRNVLSRYYSRGTKFGMSIASVMFLLAEKLGRSDNSILWLAILGLTSQYVHSKIEHGLYEGLAKGFQSDVRAFNKTRQGENQRRNVGKPADADDGRIRVVEQELRFTLYRHWSLENSMYHSSYVAGKLGIWKEQGLSMLRGLMAKMGLSLAQCRQTYEHMDLELRESLVSRLQSIAPEYGLTECVYPSFVRTFGFRSTAMSAADTVDGLDALLSAAHGVRIEVDAPGLAFGSAGVGSGGLRGAYAAAIGEAAVQSDMFRAKRLWSCGISKTDAQNGLEEAPSPSTAATWLQNFFTAYNALDFGRSESIRLLRASLSLSKALHDVVIRQGVFVIEKELVRTLRSFRLVIIKESPDLSLLTNVQVLQRLGFWLADALRDIVERQEARRKKRKFVNAAGRHGKDDDDEGGPTTLPFVVAALDEAHDRYTVVGVNASMQYGSIERNNFGLLFQEAAAASHARTKHDQFESSAVEVRKHDLPAFVEALHGML